MIPENGKDLCPLNPQSVTTNKHPAKGCCFNSSPVKPILAVVMYKSSRVSPPKVHEVTFETGIGILLSLVPVSGSHRETCQPSQCAIHNIPSESIVIPSGK